jgi:hypothetical protein
MEKIFTVKAVVSRKVLLASVFATFKAMGEAFGDNPSAQVPQSDLTAKINELFEKEMDLLKDQAYLEAAIARVKAESQLMKIAESIKSNLDVALYMDNVIESIDKEYIVFTDVGIQTGDFVFTLKPELCMAHFKASQKNVSGKGADYSQTEAASLHEEFKSDIALAQAEMNSVIASGLLEKYKHFSALLLNAFFTDNLKTHKMNDIIKFAIADDLGEFNVLGAAQ